MKYIKSIINLIAAIYIIIGMTFELLALDGKLDGLPKEILIPLLFLLLPGTILSTSLALLGGTIYFYIGLIPSFFLIRWIVRGIYLKINF